MKKVLWLFCLFSCSLSSQEKTSLKNILNTLSNTYNIQFSYNEKEVQKVETIFFDENKPLEETLVNLSSKTELVFEKIDKENYIIRSYSDQKKSICGTIYSHETKEEIPFVNIFFGNKSVYTNSEGKFEINEILEDSYITIHSLEYTTKRVLVSTFNKGCKNIYIEKSVNQLAEILITNYLTKGFSKNKDGSIVLNPKNMGILPGVIEPDVLQTLQFIPGVQSPDETASGIHIRGGTPDQNLVVFDGIKMYNFAHYFGLISAFNPYITSDVKLYRSGTHVKYGNTVGGVIDINTDKKIVDQFSAGFGSTFTHSDFYIKTPLFHKKVGFVFSARRSITDIVDSYTNNQFSDVVFQNNRISNGVNEDNPRIKNPINNYFYEDYVAKVIVEPNKKNKFLFSYIQNKNDLKFTGSIENRNENRTFEDDLETVNYGFGANWQYGSKEKNLHKISLYNTNYKKEYNGFTKAISLRGGENNTTFFKKNSLSENALEYIYEKFLTKHSRLEIGYQYNNYDVFYDFIRDETNNPVISSPVEGTTYNNALFSEYKLKNKKWLLNLGLRWQNFKGLEKSYLEPRLNVNYKINNYFNIKASTELKHQSISQIQDFREDSLRGLFSKYWNLSNKRLFPVLKSFQNSLGINFKKNGWDLDIEIYDKHIEGVTLLFDENIKGKKYFSGRNTVRGLDVLLKKKWNQYNTWVSYSISKSIYMFDDLNNNEAFDGSYDIPHYLIWSHNYTYKNYEFSLGWRFRSGTPYSKKVIGKTVNIDRIKIEFEDFNANRLPNYQRLDFAASYNFVFNKKKAIRGKAGLTLQNILNRRNILNRDYLTAIGSNIQANQELNETDRISLGFVPNMVFRIDF